MTPGTSVAGPGWATTAQGVLEAIALAGSDSPAHEPIATGRAAASVARAILAWLDIPPAQARLAGAFPDAALAALAEDRSEAGSNTVSAAPPTAVLFFAGTEAVLPPLDGVDLLVAVLPNDTGMGARLAGSAGLTTPLSTAANGRADVQFELTDAGFSAQRTAIVYAAIDAVLITPAAESPVAPTARAVAAFAGDLEVGTSVLLADPMATLERSWADGTATDLADTVVLIAARDEARLSTAWPRGHLWRLQQADADPRWRSFEDIEVSADSWSVRARPAGDPSEDAGAREPHVPRRREVRLPHGQRGDHVLIDAIANRGVDDDRVHESLRAWWTAALTVHAIPEPTRPLDVRPRDFIVDDAGRWHHDGGGVLTRIRLPLAVVAFRGLADVVRSTVRDRWISGASLATTPYELVRRLAGAVEPAIEPYAMYLWAAIESDLARRRNAAGRDAADESGGGHSRLADEMQAAILSTIERLPVFERERATNDLACAAREARRRQAHEVLRVELAEAMTELRVARGRSGARG